MDDLAKMVENGYGKNIPEVVGVFFSFMDENLVQVLVEKFSQKDWAIVYLKAWESKICHGKYFEELIMNVGVDNVCSFAGRKI